MKKLRLYIATACLLPLLLAAGGGCAKVDEPAPTQEETKTISFSIDAPQLNTRSTNTDFTIQRIDLLICDEEERVLQKASTVKDGDKYRAQVVYSTEKRIVHFIANYDWEGWNDTTHLGKDAREVLAGISTDKFTAWKRVVLNNGITEQEPFGTTPIELICNMAKFTLSVTTSALTNVSFAIYNYDKGTIATFNPRAVGDGHYFEEGIITVPANATLKTPTATDFVPMATGAIFTPERENSKATSDYSCMLIKGTFNGQQTYYKIDIVNSMEVRQDIVRNNSYVVEISSVTNIGHPDIASALASAADNTNFSLDESLEVYPSITDGTRKLEVDKNFIVITNDSESANFTATYSVKSGANWTVENHRLKSPATILPVAGFEPSVTSATVNLASGLVTVNKNSVPASGELRSKVQVVVDYLDAGHRVKLYRSVMVIVRAPYVMEAWQVGTVARTQKSQMDAKIKLPANFPKELLPLNVKFKTNNFYPHADNPMRFTVQDQTPVYIYTIPDTYVPGTDLPLKFVSNRANSAETIVVSASSCNSVNMAITTN